MNEKLRAWTDEEYEEISSFAMEILEFLEGKNAAIVMHALEMVYAYIGVSTDVHIHTMMNNIMANYKKFKKDLEDEEDKD